MATVQDYFERALRRAADPPSGIPGEPCYDQDGATAQFWISADASGRIAAARYRCTTCMTLVALCEHLAELMKGKTVGAASGPTAERLLALHQEVPPARQSRALLAVSAMQSAVAKQFEGARF